VPILGAALGVLFLMQNCSDVNLQPLDDVAFLSSSKNPFRLDPPIDRPQPRRIVLLVDMSNSMVSGPCPQDVDGGPIFAGRPQDFVAWDPNKFAGNPREHFASGADCQIDRNLPIHRDSIVMSRQPSSVDYNQRPIANYKTHRGIDHENDRLKMLETWLMQTLANPPAIRNQTSIMIVPVTGGDYQTGFEKRIMEITRENSAYSFLKADDPKLSRIVSALINEHVKNVNLSDDEFQSRYEARTMGTTTISGVLRNVQRAITSDMTKMKTEPGLRAGFPFSQYQVIHISDGRLTPIEQDFVNTMKFYQPCRACAERPDTCTGLCTTLAQNLVDAWGPTDDNNVDRVDFAYSVLQGLPSFMGGSFVQIDFVQLKPERFAAIHPVGEVTYFEKLKPKFEGRGMSHKIWPVDDDRPPFRLLGDASQPVAYQVSHVFLLNANARLDPNGEVQVDSDGDGLFDKDESGFATSPTNPRTDGYCLDSIAVDPAFSARCASFQTTRSCDPHFDADMDGLNECEESVLATRPTDFDTDDDGIPDGLEWIYGYNPLVSDSKIDSNADGTANALAFANGVGPSLDLRATPNTRLMQYQLNSKGKEILNLPGGQQVTVELNELILRNMTARRGVVVPAAQRWIMSTEKNDRNFQFRIPPELQLLGSIERPTHNTLMGLARMVDQANPEQAYWRYFKVSVPDSNNIQQPLIDLSQFKLLPARDRIN
jgi:hypothetical protein